MQVIKLASLRGGIISELTAAAQPTAALPSEALQCAGKCAICKHLLAPKWTECSKCTTAPVCCIVLGVYGIITAGWSSNDKCASHVNQQLGLWAHALHLLALCIGRQVCAKHLGFNVSYAAKFACRASGGSGDSGGQPVAGGCSGAAICGACQPPRLEGTLPVCPRGQPGCQAACGERYAVPSLTLHLLTQVVHNKAKSS